MDVKNATGAPGGEWTRSLLAGVLTVDGSLLSWPPAARQGTQRGNAERRAPDSSGARSILRESYDDRERVPVARIATAGHGGFVEQAPGRRRAIPHRPGRLGG
jgi:hypothetical protein